MAAAVETKLYVTNFPSSATRQQLQQFFSRFGRVQECAIMWNSYAFVHYATMEEARRALEQSNGAMFLNRKLIVQLSTSRFRPQPKETNISIAQPTKQLMGMNTSSVAYGGSTILKEQQPQQQSNYSDANYDIMTSNNIHQQSLSPSPDNQSYFRPPFSLVQELHNYYSQFSNMSIDRMTPTSSSSKLNNMKSNKMLKTDIGFNGEIPKLYCTNLPDNCKTNDLQRLFSSFGHVVDCVILWDYYAFITFKTFLEAERALIALNGYTWKDRRLIVEWSRASGRKQQQQISPSSTPPRLGSFGSDLSTPPSPRTRPSTLLNHPPASNNQFYRNNSPLKTQSTHHTFNQNLALMSIMQQPYLNQHSHHTSSIPYTNYQNGNHSESISNENQQIFDNLTSSSSNHRLDISSFVDTNTSNGMFSSSSEVNTPSSITSLSNVYQPSDIVALLESSTSDMPLNNKTNTLSSTTNNVPPSCSSAAAAGAAALYQENILSSLFNTFEPFNKIFSNDEQSTTSRYNHLSPLLTTAPDNSYYPVSFGHNVPWH